MVAAVYLCMDLVDREQQELRRTTKTDADHIASRLQAGILRNFEPLNQLAAFWLTQDKPLVQEDWDSDTHLFLGRTPGILRVAWVANDGFVHWWAVPGAAPHTGRVAVEPGAAEAIQAAGRLVSLALSAPVEGAGGLELYAAAPIWKGTIRRGYVVGRYNVASLLAPLVKGELRPGDSLVLKAGGSPLYVSDQIGRSPTSSADSSLRVQNQTWTMSLEISRSYFRDFRGAIATVAGVIGALVYSAVLLIFLSHRRSAQMERANSALRDEMELRRRTESAMGSLNLELRRKVADFETLLDVIPIGIAVADDPACRSIRTNPALARMMGVPRSLNISKTGPEAGRLPYRILRNGQEVPPGELAMQMAAATRAAVLGDENQIVKSDGSTVHVLNFASPLFDEEGNVRGVLNACVDISERKAREQVRRELEQRLQRAERRKSLGVMAAGIAHDFNNLLTSIIGQASLAASRLPQGHAARENLDSSLEAAEKAAALIHQVLAYTGQAHQALVETSLPRVVDELRPRLADLATGTAELHFHISESLPNVMANADQIRHMLEHLVRNAIEAMEQEKNRGTESIEVTVDQCKLAREDIEMALHEGWCAPGWYVRIEVRDLAGGMPAEIAERAFDPFFSTKFVGRGMGLSEVLGIMRAHQGAVRLRSVLNAGTSVELFFPAQRNQGGVTGNDKGQPDESDLLDHPGLSISEVTDAE